MAIQQPSNGFSGYVQQLTILHASLVMGVALMGVVMYFVAGPATDENTSGSSLFNWLAPSVAIGGLLASSIMFRMQVQNAQAKGSLTDKLAGYRAASITRYAVIEGPAILCFVAYFLEGQMHYLYLGGLLLIVLFLYRPSKDRIINDLALNAKEQAELVG
ncbi:MAG: hypothetical protein HUU34_04530 [Saprospiraceae bacterium]|nr:hypothetical protein [Saprospiraceae bacterium]